MERLMSIAAELGVRVMHGALPAENGIYYRDLGLVVLHVGLSETLELCTLAHELGHAHHGHTDTSEASEFAANRFAARLLIDDREYAAAEGMSDSPLFIAQELGVTLALVRAYLPSGASVRA
ncbi:hypothetical protein BLJ79_21410 [Arthrobacter sp. UCD-GKA]|nr:hypothetical protein BLJ79_21410 [Arthrobacter sp. UCD-GKA]